MATLANTNEGYVHHAVSGKFKSTTLPWLGCIWGSNFTNTYLCHSACNLYTMHVPYLFNIFHHSWLLYSFSAAVLNKELTWRWGWHHSNCRGYPNWVISFHWDYPLHIFNILHTSPKTVWWEASKYKRSLSAALQFHIPILWSLVVLSGHNKLTRHILLRNMKVIVPVIIVLLKQFHCC